MNDIKTIFINRELVAEADLQAYDACILFAEQIQSTIDYNNFKNGVYGRENQ